jgi:thiosulfate/3-mercaptopyruvate sulfurtransferase
MSVPLLVSSEWLAGHLDDPRVRIADVRWSLLDRERGVSEYRKAHIPGAVFLDVESELSSPRGEGPGRHPLPAPERFAAAMARAGIGPDTHVIAYDFADGSTAARLWWLLHYFGHRSASLLDGGIARWESEGRPLEAGAVSPARLRPAARSPMVVDAAAVERLRSDPRALLIDARARERYEGKVEPVDPFAGHIPGARSLPVAGHRRSAEDPRFPEPEALRVGFAELGADRAERVVCYCGSGVNACANLFALRLAGIETGVLYEGSWSDWCAVPARPRGVGPTWRSPIRDAPAGVNQPGRRWAGEPVV